jgi:peptidyl-prolyl cis-trans isomerase A (cyclophilin A)
MIRLRVSILPILALAVACASPDTPAVDSAAVAPKAPAAPDVSAAPAQFRVRMETSKGPIIIEAHRDWSPNGVDRFYQLVESGYYDDVRFFRVVPGFVVQFGMHGDPAIHARWADRGLMDEPVMQTNRRGTVTFAKGGPNSRTTQLFINLGDNAMLDPQGFPPFGTVVEGMSVVDALYSGYADQPTQRQPEIAAEGNAFLNREYPRLDFIKTAKVVK